MVKLSLFLNALFRKKPIIPLLIAGIILFLAFFRIYTTRFGTDLLSYIPEEAKKTKAYLEALRHSGGERNCYIMLKGNVLGNIELIDRIAAGLRKLPEIVDVHYKVDRDLRDFYLNMLKKKLPLYMDSGELDALSDRLTPDGMNEAIKRTQLRLMMPGGGEIGRIDPLGLTDFIKPFPGIEGPVDTSSGYYILQRGKGLILIASVSGDPRDISFDRKLLNGIDGVMKRQIKETDKISVTVTGSHAITYYEASQMKEEMKRNTLLSILLVGAVLIIFIRDIRVMLYTFLPVGISIFISLGFYSLVFGHLTEAAGGFAAMLIGLGVDLTIILYIRNLFLRDIEQSIKATAPGIWAGALTTAATFSPMAISHFRGIKELGILTSTGIVFCAVVLFGIVSGIMKPGTYINMPYNLSFLSRLLPRKAKLNIALLFIPALFSLWVIKDMRFSVDLKELGSEKNPARLALDEVIKENSKKVFLIGDSMNPEDAIKKADEVERLLRNADIKDVISIAAIVPPIEKQLMVIDRLKNINKEKVIRDFVEIANRAGFSHQFINNYAEGLREMLSLSKPLRYEDIKNIGLFKERFLWNNEKGVGYLIVINNVNAEKIPAIDGITITDREIIKKELTGLLKKDALKITLLGFFLVNLILFITFKRPLDILFVQLPIIIAILFTGAILTLMGHNIHIMSAITGVMLFGIGTDYAIYFVYHIRRERDIGRVLSQTGTAIILSALTTVCGFGTLYFSSYRGLSDMGLAIMVGILFSLIFIFLFIPLYAGQNRKIQ